MKLIELHKKWMETGVLPSHGLCNSLKAKYFRTLLDLFAPPIEANKDYVTFWAYPLTLSQEGSMSYMEMALPYTPTRQTIVLLICAIHGEL